MKRVTSITVDEGHLANNKPFFVAHFTHEGDTEAMFSAEGDNIPEALTLLGEKITKFHADQILNDNS